MTKFVAAAAIVISSVVLAIGAFVADPTQALAVGGAPAHVTPPALSAASTTPLASAKEELLRIVGGSPAQQIEIREVASRFESAGLTLEPLTVFVHEDTEACEGAAGLFWPNPEGDRIELCRDGAHLVAHEMAHAWAYHALDDHDRAAFVSRTEMPTWKSLDHPHGLRATEVAADAIAFGLVPEPLAGDSARRALSDLEHFVFLTGFEPPRLVQSLADIAAMPMPTIDPAVSAMYSVPRGT